MKMPNLKKLPSLPKLNLSQLLGLVNQNRNTIFLLGAVIVVILNVVIQPFALRLDFSKNQANTLSSSTKKLLRNLDQNVTFTFYQSADLPTRLQPIKQDVQDLLNEYRRESQGKITVEVKDPKTDEKAREYAIQSGITELKFSQMDQDKFNVSTGYFGLLVNVGEQKRAIPQLNDLANLEYNITSGIYSLVRTDTAKIAVVNSMPSFDMQQRGDPLGVIKEVLQQQYVIESLEFSQPQSVPTPGEEMEISPTPDLKEIDASIKTILLVADQGRQYSSEDIARLNKYIKNKGNVIAFIDGISINEQVLATEEAKHNLFGFSESYGITVNKDLVLSASAELVNFGDQVQSLFLPYPYWFKTNSFDTNTGLFSNVNFLTYPWASSLTVNNKSGFSVEEIIKTSSQSYRETGTFILDPQRIASFEPQSFSQLTIGAISSVDDGGKLMVIPSTRFVQTQYLSRESGNINFILNAVNDYASAGALSGIRQRSVQLYPLPELSNSSKDIFKYANMLLLPAIFALGGAFYLLKRK